MGLLSWLFRKPAFELQPDRIFLTRSAMLEDFARQCRAAMQSHDRVLLVTHFEESRQAILGQFKTLGVKLHEESSHLNNHAVHSLLSDQAPTLVLAEQLSVNETTLEPDDKSLRVAVLIAERHPLRRHDEHIEQFAATLSATSRLTYFGALDGAVYRRFAGAWVTDLLKNLGMKPDEVIESQLVTRRLIAAQQKIAAEMFSDTSADSAEEWCERNLPNS